MNPSCPICKELLQNIFNRNKEVLSKPEAKKYIRTLYNIETGIVDDIDSWLICFECIINEELLFKHGYRYATDKEIERYTRLSKFL